MAFSAEVSRILSSDSEQIYDLRSHALGPQGRLPLTEQMLIESPSGDVFGWSQNVGMGWDPSRLEGKQILLLGTQGGIREPDGRPVALGYHTGHYEIGMLMEEAALELRESGCIPFAGFCSDPCDGRTQGTPGMMDSLAYRNDAATVLRRLIRSLPTRTAVLGAASCDKGLPAMMMALASMRDLPCLLMPGGVTLPPTSGEDLGKIQSIGARFAHGEISLDYAREMGCRTCASPGGGCQFLGTAATSQVVAEALGLALPHSALAPSGQAIWRDMARRSARAVLHLHARGMTTKVIVTDAAIRNAMAVHAAFGGSTNLLLHIPAIAYSAGLRRPSVEDWTRINRQAPRLVDVLPNGPVGHPTVRVFLAGGVPEVMLHLRDLGLLELDAITAAGEPVGKVLEWWESSDRRSRLQARLLESDGVDPGDVIMSPERARERGLTSTVTFPTGNLAPEGSVVKSTAIDPSVIDADGVYRKTGPARVFLTEKDAVRAIKDNAIRAGDVLLLICAGPRGSGMEEILQVTGALKHLSFGKHVAVVTDARFSGVSTGACIGHVGPEALGGGPIGKVRSGDVIRIEIDTKRPAGRLDLVGEASTPADRFSPELGDQILNRRPSRPDLSPRTDLPDDTRLWAALQAVGGGTWGGCVYDVDKIIQLLERAK
ncbi:MAG: YjhG/YagF family D-xylonate dehydratase [Acidobacteriota bacterium]